MKNRYFYLVPGLISLLIHVGIVSGNDQGAVSDQATWKQEYEEVCGKTQNAMTLSTDELKEHLDRCDVLGERIGELNGPEGTERKIYTKRLKMCRELYEFALEYKKEKE